MGGVFSKYAHRRQTELRKLLDIHRDGAIALGMRRRERSEEIASALATVKQIYLELGQRPAQRQCLRRTECCQFKLTGLTPYLTKGEALVAARALRASGRKALPDETEGACPLLEKQSGKCLIYNDRPFACRTHYCAAAGGPIARGEVIDLIRRLETIDTQLDGTGARKLPAAVKAALTELA